MKLEISKELLNDEIIGLRQLVKGLENDIMNTKERIFRCIDDLSTQRRLMDEMQRKDIEYNRRITECFNEIESLTGDKETKPKEGEHI